MEVDTEQLISLVFERPALWDKRLKSHSNRNTVEKAWKEICLIMKTDEQKLRKKWKYLRDQFAIELSKIKPPRSGDGVEDIQTSKWPHFKILFFLKDVIKPRPASGNLLNDSIKHATSSLNVVPGTSQEEVSFSPQVDDESETLSGLDIETTPNENKGNEMETTAPPDTHLKKQTPNIYNRVRNRKPYANPITESLIDIERQKLKILTERSEKRTPSTDIEDDDLYFLKSLLPYIKNIPPYRKLQFRGRIQEVVQEFAYPNTTSTTNTHSSDSYMSNPMSPLQSPPPSDIIGESPIFFNY